MSDDGSDYDFADVIFEDDWDTFDEPSIADDLAENVTPSPVWTSYDPKWDMESPKSDWEEYLGDGFDNDEGRIARKRGVDVKQVDMAPDQVPRTRTPKTKHRFQSQLQVTEERCSSLEPTVIWRSRNKKPSPSPTRRIVGGGCEKQVSLLSNWREKFNIKTQGSNLSRHCYQNSGTEEERTTASENLYDAPENLRSVSKSQNLTMEPKRHREADGAATKAFAPHGNLPSSNGHRNSREQPL